MNYNKVIVAGRLGQDPEVKFTADGTPVTNLSIATSKKKKTGEQVTEWHRCVLFGRNAEVAGDYLKKGSTALIEGELRTRKWQDQQGNDKYTTEIVGFTMQMGDKASGGIERPAQQPQQQHASQGQQQHASQGQQGNRQHANTGQQSSNQQQPNPRNHQPAQQAGGFDAPVDFDEDLPF